MEKKKRKTINISKKWQEKKRQKSIRQEINDRRNGKRKRQKKKPRKGIVLKPVRKGETNK